MEFRTKFWLFAIVGLYGCCTVGVMAADADVPEFFLCALDTPTEVLHIIEDIKLRIEQQQHQLEEAIKAAKENKEPAYLDKWVQAYGEKLKAWASSKTTYSPKEQVAFIIMMRSIITVGYYTITGAGNNAAYNVAGNAAYCIANGATWSAAKDAGFNIAYEAAQIAVWSATYHDTYYAAYYTARDAARNAMNGEVLSNEAISRIAYRIAEWRVLNYLLDHPRGTFDTVFKAALRKLPENLEAPQFSQFCDKLDKGSRWSLNQCLSWLNSNIPKE